LSGGKASFDLLVNNAGVAGTLDPIKEATNENHWHDFETIIFVLEGENVVTVAATGETLACGPGSRIDFPVGLFTTRATKATGPCSASLSTRPHSKGRSTCPRKPGRAEGAGRACRLGSINAVGCLKDSEIRLGDKSAPTPMQTNIGKRYRHAEARELGLAICRRRHALPPCFSGDHVGWEDVLLDPLMLVGGHCPWPAMGGARQ
jgi:hypothetical protein